jgi:hypothetical protein
MKRHLMVAATSSLRTVTSGVSLIVAATGCVEASEVRVWLAPSGGYSTYTMTAINDRIRALNPIYRPEHRLEEISGGASLGVQVGVDFTAQWMAAFGYERLWAGSEGGSSEYDLPAHVFEANGGYARRLTSQLRAGLELGLGIVMAADANVGSPGTTVTITGHDLALDASLWLEYVAWTRVGFWAKAGYRDAKIDEIEGDGEVWRLPDGTPLSLDYSGLILRLGTRITLF